MDDMGIPRSSEASLIDGYLAIWVNMYLSSIMMGFPFLGIASCF